MRHSSVIDTDTGRCLRRSLLGDHRVQLFPDHFEIRLEHEAHYDWVAFVPQRESDAGALTKYFRKGRRRR